MFHSLTLLLLHVRVGCLPHELFPGGLPGIVGDLHPSHQHGNADGTGDGAIGQQLCSAAVSPLANLNVICSFFGEKSLRKQPFTSSNQKSTKT